MREDTLHEMLTAYLTALDALEASSACEWTAGEMRAYLAGHAAASADLTATMEMLRDEIAALKSSLIACAQDAAASRRT